MLIPLQLVAVLALADLSYRFVELPFRGKAKLPRLPEDWLRFGRPALFVAVPAIVLLVGWSGIAGSGDQPPARPGGGLDGNGREGDSRRTTRWGWLGARPCPGDRSKEGPRAPRIVALGDSVMIGAKEQLAAQLGPGFSMDARVSRQANEFVALARKLKADGRDPDALIIQMGNNGPPYSDLMEELREATSNVGELFFINDYAPVSWLGESDHALAEAAKDWPHTTLIDWSSIAAAHDHLPWDGIHLTPAGAGVYARLVARAVRADEQR